MPRLLATAALLVIFAIPAAAADFPKGTLSVAAPDGTKLVMKIDGKGKFSVLAGDTEVVHGTYKVEKDEIEFTDVGGSGAGTGDEKVGTYKWKLEDKKVTFTAVKDAAAARKGALTIGAWALKE